jgi:SAM-dependent MidA family methyltransferase
MPALPAPSPEAAQHSRRLTQLIREEIRKSGWLSFARYMELALYAPGLGYYAAGAAKFGPGGDFVTAPEISPLFGRSLAHCLADVLAETGGDILELGAGSGRLAEDVLQELARLDCLPRRYLILEPSAELAARQKQRLAALPATLAGRVQWLEELPEKTSGVVFGNEVLDALPVHLLLRRDGIWLERGVTVAGDAFVWEDRPCGSPALIAQAAALDLPEDYLVELHPAAVALVASLARRLAAGMLLFIDYGFGRAEYYHPERRTGTLLCHYRHHVHDDPFFWPGLADITAHVEFTAIAEAALGEGLELLGYTSQAAFLLGCGITERLAETPVVDARYPRLAAQVQTLLSPAEMGELVKVIGFARNLHRLPAGFGLRDARHRL